MPDEYEILRADVGHRAMICRLQTGLWSPDPAENERHLHHRYEANCFPGDSHIYLALHRGRAVGMRGFHGAAWEAGSGGETHHGLMAGDAMIAPGHRDRGMVTRILQFATTDLHARGYDYLFSLGASRVNVLGLLTQGWRSAGAMLPLGRVRPHTGWRQRARKQARRLPWLWRFSETKFLHSADELEPFTHLDHAGRERGISLSRSPPLELMVRLVADQPHDGRIRHRRDRAYLEWRYSSNLREYRFLSIDEGPGQSAYLVLGRLTSPLANFSRVQIIDLEANDNSLRERLLRHALQAGQFHELVTWGVAHTPADQRLLEELGFAETDQHERIRGCPCLLVKCLDPSRPPDHWRLGDSELLKPVNWDLRLLYSFRA